MLLKSDLRLVFTVKNRVVTGFSKCKTFFSVLCNTIVKYDFRHSITENDGNLPLKVRRYNIRNEILILISFLFASSGQITAFLCHGIVLVLGTIFRKKICSAY